MRTVSLPAAVFPIAEALSKPRILVPTMGALHDGHRALLTKARELAGQNGSVMVSIFVNPIQFGPHEDLAQYPRPLERDLEICANAGVDLVFTPSSEEMYPGGISAVIDETRLSTSLCGESRPGHFRGVCTVVGKLFHLLQPQIAVFGEKDFQQLAIIRRMVRDLNFPVEIVGCPTVREDDGLALSSRNQFLSASERAVAPVIREALLAAQEEVANGEANGSEICHRVRLAVERVGGRVDYVRVVHLETLEEKAVIEKSALIAVAVFFGKTRLIDNIELLQPDRGGVSP